MIEIIPVTNINLEGIKLLRRFSSFSISEIREAARNQKPVISIEEFSNEWQSDRICLSELAKIYMGSRQPVFVVQVRESDEDVSSLSPGEFIKSLKGLRELELETQRHSDLECGYIINPSEFVAHDEDWT